MSRIWSLRITIIILLIFFIISPIFLFNRLQEKLENKVESLESYNQLKEKDIEFHGRNAYIIMPKENEGNTQKVMEDIGNIKGIRNVKIIYKDIGDTSNLIGDTEETESDVSKDELEKDDKESLEDKEEIIEDDASSLEEVEISDSIKDEEALDKFISEADFIEFEYGTAELTDESKVLLESYAKEILKLKVYSFKIVGYTDSVGSQTNNLTLSLDRAEMVMNTLVSSGVDADSLVAIGKGKLEPIAPNKTEEGRKFNRRVEILKGEN